VEDLAKWDANFYNPVVGGQGLLERMHTRGILNDGDTIDYALGLTVDEYRGLHRVQHGGAWAGFRAMLARFPEQRTSVIIECNRGDANVGEYTDGVVDAVLAGSFTEAADEADEDTSPPEDRQPVELPSDVLERWEGAYVSDASPPVLVFEVRGARFFVLAQGMVLPVRAFSETEFEVTGVGIPVTFSEDGGVTLLSSVATLTPAWNIPRPQPSNSRSLWGGIGVRKSARPMRLHLTVTRSGCIAVTESQPTSYL
jgi:hypothetical protein